MRGNEGTRETAPEVRRVVLYQLGFISLAFQIPGSLIPRRLIFL